MIGLGGNDRFVFQGGFGTDTIADFDAIAAGGQDMMDISGLGISAASFAGAVSVVQMGGNAVVTIGGNTITLNGVNASDVTQDDFLFAP